MKSNLLFAFVFFGQICNAQFSTDPSTPLFICNASGNQSFVQSLKDSHGGSYVFWLDARDSQHSKVYAQHVDILGNKILSPQGIIIDQSASNVSSYKIIPWQQGFLLAWFENQDSLMAQYLDTNFAPIWPMPTCIAKPGEGAIGITPLNSVYTFSNAEGATFTYTIIWTGGSTFFGFNKINFSGDLLTGNLSKKFALNGYDYATVGCNDGGWYALSKGNGITSQLSVHRFNLNGDTLWGKQFSPNGPEGLGGIINLLTNATNDLYIIWDAANSKILGCKLLNNGDFGWNSPRIMISDSTYDSYNCIARIKNDTIYTAYRHQMDFGAVLQMQKLNADGQKLWGNSGVMIDTIFAYYFRPKIALNDSGMVTVFYSPVSNTFGAQKVDANGNVVWTDGVLVCDKYQAGNFYEDIAPLDNYEGCSPVFWTGLDSEIYGAVPCWESSEPTEIPEFTSKENLSIFPNPAQDHITIKLPENENSAQLQVFNLMGQKVVQQKITNRITSIATSNWESGIYFFEVVGKLNQQIKVVIQ